MNKTPTDAPANFGPGIYAEHGYRDREDYLRCLADEFEVSFQEVALLSELLGPSEDFDGLRTAIEDFAGGW